MRAIVSQIMFYLAYLVGAGAAGAWGYFIWGLDWGTSFRARGLWWMVFGIGSVLAFLVGCFLVLILNMQLFPTEDGK
jgi:hypothetical protein